MVLGNLWKYVLLCVQDTKKRISKVRISQSSVELQNYPTHLKGTKFNCLSIKNITMVNTFLPLTCTTFVKWMT